MTTTIAQLRSLYRDHIYPLDDHRIFYSGIMIRIEYIDINGEGKRGVFRVHPRLPQIEIWPNTKSAHKALQKLMRFEGEIRDRINLMTSLRAAKESIAKARVARKPPDRNDMSIIQNTWIRPGRTRRTWRDERCRAIKIQNIEDVARSVQSDLIIIQEVSPDPIEIALRPDAPVKLLRFSPIKLIMELI